MIFKGERSLMYGDSPHGHGLLHGAGPYPASTAFVFSYSGRCGKVVPARSCELRSWQVSSHPANHVYM